MGECEKSFMNHKGFIKKQRLQEVGAVAIPVGGCARTCGPILWCAHSSNIQTASLLDRLASCGQWTPRATPAGM